MEQLCHQWARASTRTFKILTALVFSLVAANECSAVRDSFHAPQEFVSLRTAAAWVVLGSVAGVAVSLVSAFVLSVFPKTYRLSRWAMSATRWFILLAVAGVLIGLLFTTLMIISYKRMAG